MKKLNERCGRIIFCGIILIVFYKLADNYTGLLAGIGKMISVIKPLIVGTVIAFFMSKPSYKLESVFKKSKRNFIKNKARVFGVLISYIVVLLLIAFACVVVAPKLYKNAQDFVYNVPKYYNVINNYIDKNEYLSKLAILDNIKDWFFGLINMENVNKWVMFAKSIANSFISAFVAVVISIYLIFDKDKIFCFLKSVRAKHFRNHAADVVIMYGRRIIDLFYSYMAGMFIDSVVMGIITAVVLTLFKVPYAILLGLLCMIGNLIPFFGPIISSVSIFLINALTIGPIKAVGVLVFQLVLGQIDGNLIQPRILSSSTGISPLLVLLSVLIFGDLFGVIGMIIGVPVCAMIKIIVMDFLDNGKLDGSGE